MRIISTSNKNENSWCCYEMGRIRVVGYLRIIYTPKSVFSYQYHKFLFSFGVAYYLYAFSLDRALYNSTVVE